MSISQPGAAHGVPVKDQHSQPIYALESGPLVFSALRGDILPLPNVTGDLPLDLHLQHYIKVNVDSADLNITLISEPVTHPSILLDTAASDNDKAIATQFD